MANGRSRVDWAAAKAFFVALPKGERTNRRVAAEFSVSEQSVGKHARDERWLEIAAEHDRELERRLLSRAIRTREERGAALLRIADEVYDQVGEKLLDGSLEIKLSDLPAIDRMVRLELGEATDRITVDEMRSGFQTLLVVAIGFVPKARQPEFLEAANAALGVSVEGEEAA